MDIQQSKKTYRNPWAWVPSLYFAEGIPYVIVMTLSVIMYKRLGISNTDIALYTSWLYLPWVIKPFWSPLIDILKTKRYWIISMQLIIGAGLAGVALTIPLPSFFQYTLAFFWLLAFSSATHDIAADGFYMLGLTQNQQAFFVGIRSTFYRFAMLTGQGLIVILAGYFEAHTGFQPTEISLSAKNTAAEYRLMPLNSTQTEGIISMGDIEMGNSPVEKAKADSLIQFAKQSNVQNGFYSEEKIAQKNTANQTDNTENGLERFLRTHFGRTVKEVDKSSTGNVALVGFRLASQPTDNTPIVLNFNRQSGDASFILVEGGRYEFTQKNWNTVAYAAIQLDPKLKNESAAVFTATSGNIPLAWTIAFFILAALFGLFFVYHRFFLPYPPTDKASVQDNVFKEFFITFIAFFKRKNILIILTFLLFYRLGESQLVKMAAPFLLDSRELGGLGLTTGNIGLIYGTIGMIALTLGGILGGIFISKFGLNRSLWWMLLIMNLPHVSYVYLSYAQPESHWIIAAMVAIEQFGYGFGFTAYMLYMIFISEGKYKTAHFAICTGFMALGMMLPGMMSGWLQNLIGYQHFFLWVLICTLPILVVALFVKVDPLFGLKGKEEEKK